MLKLQSSQSARTTCPYCWGGLTTSPLNSASGLTIIRTSCPVSYGPCFAIERKNARRRAEAMFEVMGMRGSAAIPELLRQAPQHVDARDMRAFSCLCYMGEASFHAVARMATDHRSAVRGEAVFCIQSMRNLGTNTAAAVRLLCELTTDSDRQIVEEAVRG